MLNLAYPLVLLSAFVALVSASLYAPRPIIEVIQVTTTTSKLLDTNCHFKCYIAKQFLDGELEPQHLWLYNNVPKGIMLRTMCAKEMCSRCAFCGGGKEIEEEEPESWKKTMPKIEGFGEGTG